MQLGGGGGRAGAVYDTFQPPNKKQRTTRSTTRARSSQHASLAAHQDEDIQPEEEALSRPGRPNEGG